MVIRWSFSKLSKVEQCGTAYYRHYELGERGPSSDPLRKGSLVHETLEAVARVAVAKKYIGLLDVDKTLALYATLWEKHYPDGGSIGHYRDGEDIVAAWVDRKETIDYRRIVAIEERFEIGLPNGDTLTGFIDLIERDDSGRLVIVDYKTNRAMYSKDEVEESLQLGIYALAASKIYPDESPLLAYDMLRHGYRQLTERTPADLESIERYIGTLAARVRRWQAGPAPYPESLNTLCGWCPHRALCGSYQKALNEGELEDIDPQDLDALAIERERVAAVEKIAKGRKYEIDTLLKTKIKEDGPVTAGGRVYKLSKTTKRTHDPGRVSEALADALGGDSATWLSKVSAVSNDKLKRAIKASELDRSGQIILQARIDSLAKERSSTMLRSSKEAR